jgi:hypothetical protein
MHYFTHGSAIAAVEDVTQAAKYAEAGWIPCSHAYFMHRWKERDLAQLASLPPIEVAAPKAGDVIERLPNGYARFHV